MCNFFKSRLISITSKILLVQVLFVFTINDSCVFAKKKRTQKKYERVGILQKGKDISGKKNVFIIDKASFSIRFYNHVCSDSQFYATRIAVFSNKDQIPTIRKGMKFSAISCFKPGTGMAASRELGYTALKIAPAAHHYLFYQNEESKRVNKIGESGMFSLFEFNVDSLNIEGQIESMSQTEINHLYMLVLIDRNLNNVIDKGECQKIAIQIKDKD